MAFHVRCNFNRIGSYAQAVKAWKAGVIFPADPLQADPLRAPRGLVDKRKKHLTVERTAAEDIILRLYDRPVVTWHKDNSITICSYDSHSTVVFANHCTPAEMFVSMCGGFFAVTINGRTYTVAGEITFRRHDLNDWKADKITPWSVPVVNRERAKQALHESGYNEFRLWLQVYTQMARQPEKLTGWLNNDDIVLMLRDRSKWRDLIACRFPHDWYSPDRILREVRQAVYAEYDCIDHKSVPFLG